MDSILSYQKSENEDYYKILGCDQLSSIEQIITEYKRRVIACHPDKNPDDATAHERFELLQIAKDTLTDQNSRAKYDQWLNSSVCMSWKDWLHHSNSHQMVFHWTVKKPEPMIKGSESVPQETQQKPQPTQTSNVGFNTEPSSGLIRKFRNYEI